MTKATARERIQTQIDEWQNDPDYEYEVLLLEINRPVSESMNKGNLRNSDVARRLSVSPPFVTRLLRGETNITLKTLVRVANALELKVSIQMRPRTAAARNSAKGAAPTSKLRIRAEKPSAPRVKRPSHVRPSPLPQRRRKAG